MPTNPAPTTARPAAVPAPGAAAPAVTFLDAVQVAEPCTVPWNSMRGDETVRFCGQCRMNVYDLSAVTRPEAEALLRGRGERLCVRFQRRADGTVVSSDCGPVRRSIRRRARLLRVAAAGLLAMFFPSVLAGCGRGAAGASGAPVPNVPGPDADDGPDQVKGEVYLPPERGSMGIVACPEPAPTAPEDAPQTPQK